MNLRTSPLLLGLLLLGAQTQAQDSSFHLKDGDRVVFYGDSITDQRLYTTFTETFVVTRFPKLNVQFVHSGWGGDRVGGGGGGPIAQRLERDVFAYKPTVMTIMLGMNDASYRPFDQTIFDTYSKGYESIVNSVKQTLPGIRLTLIQPSPFDDVAQPPRFEGGYNQVLVRYGGFVKELATKQGATVADLNTGVVAALEKAKAKDPEQAKKIIPDRVHPGPSGHLLMAAELLKAWKAPSTVSDVAIEVPTTVKASATRVSDLKFEGKVTWTQTDDALPLPIDLNDPVMALAVNASDLIQTLNQQRLRVSNITASVYVLSIDGSKVGQFTKEQLAEGINLAVLPTPMIKQAQEVHALTLQHNNIHFARWRQIQVPLASYKAPRTQAAVKELMNALDQEEAEVVTKQRATAQPKARQYELKPL